MPKMEAKGPQDSGAWARFEDPAGWRGGGIESEAEG